MSKIEITALGSPCPVYLDTDTGQTSFGQPFQRMSIAPSPFPGGMSISPPDPPPTWWESVVMFLKENW